MSVEILVAFSELKPPTHFYFSPGSVIQLFFFNVPCRALLHRSEGVLFASSNFSFLVSMVAADSLR